MQLRSHPSCTPSSLKKFVHALATSHFHRFHHGPSRDRPTGMGRSQREHKGCDELQQPHAKQKQTRWKQTVECEALRPNASRNRGLQLVPASQARLSPHSQNNGHGTCGDLMKDAKPDMAFTDPPPKKKRKQPSFSHFQNKAKAALKRMLAYLRILLRCGAAHRQKLKNDLKSIR